jgi:hypothetical protein
MARLLIRREKKVYVQWGGTACLTEKKNARE